MNIEISTQHTELTEGLKKSVHDKFKRLENHISKPLRLHVKLTVDGEIHRAEVTAYGAGKNLVAVANTKNMYISINKVSHLLDRQWRKIKTAKLSERHGDSVKNFSI